MGRTTRALTAAAAALALLAAGCSQQPPDVTEPAAPAQPSAVDQETPEPSPSTEQAPVTEFTPTQEAQGTGTGTGPTEEEPDAAPTSEDAGLVTELVLCGDDTYDASQEECPAHEAEFETSSVYCTATVQVEAAGALEVRFSRDGGLVQSIEAQVPDGAVGQQVPIFADTNVGELDLPGGTWTCEVLLPDGATGSGETTVSGPTERFSQGRACDNSQVFTDGVVTHCSAGSSTLPAATPEIGCSGVVNDALDAEVEVWATFDTEQMSGERLLGRLQSSSGILVVHGHMTSRGLLDEPQFLPGSYSCVLVVDGEEVGEHDFEVE